MPPEEDTEVHSFYLVNRSKATLTYFICRIKMFCCRFNLFQTKEILCPWLKLRSSSIPSLVKELSTYDDTCGKLWTLGDRNTAVTKLPDWKMRLSFQAKTCSKTDPLNIAHRRYLWNLKMPFVNMTLPQNQNELGHGLDLHAWQD